jgi:hypothetical protein
VRRALAAFIAIDLSMAWKFIGDKSPRRKAARARRTPKKLALSMSFFSLKTRGMESIFKLLLGLKIVNILSLIEKMR